MASLFRLRLNRYVSPFRLTHRLVSTSPFELMYDWIWTWTKQDKNKILVGMCIIYASMWVRWCMWLTFNFDNKLFFMSLDFSKYVVHVLTVATACTRHFYFFYSLFYLGTICPFFCSSCFWCCRIYLG
jgi:hypothetical protein